MGPLRKLVYTELLTRGLPEQEGWEPGHHDAEQFWNYALDGFLATDLSNSNKEGLHWVQQRGDGRGTRL